MPPPEQMAMLIQTSVVALSQANLTGNFTVLHALGAPGFQQANPPTKLRSDAAPRADGHAHPDVGGGAESGQPDGQLHGAARARCAGLSAGEPADQAPI